MSDYTVTIDLLPHKRGDKWVGIPQIGPVLVNGQTPAGKLTRIHCKFVHTPSDSVFVLDSVAENSPDAPIVITNEDTWAANVPEVQEFLPVAGEWFWDMEFYEEGDTSPLTFYKGKLTVNNDVTK